MSLSLVAALLAATNAVAQPAPEGDVPTYDVETREWVNTEPAAEWRVGRFNRRVVMAKPYSLVTRHSDDGLTWSAIIRLHNASAPTEYRFVNAVPEGVTATVADDGGIAFTDAAGEAAGGIAPPWAYDSAGEHRHEVPTWYTLDGTTVTQTIAHTDSDYTYPIIADPGPVLILAVLGTIVSVYLHHHTHCYPVSGNGNGATRCYGHSH